MDELEITVTLELRIAEDAVSGCAVADWGERKEFLGRIGLIAAIDALVSAPVTNACETRRTK
jgi:hypothetical protein